MAGPDEYGRSEAPFEVPAYWKEALAKQPAQKPPTDNNDGGDAAPVKVLKPGEPKIEPEEKTVFGITVRAAPPPAPPPPKEEKSKSRGFTR